ncbi:ADP-heptose synthase [Paenibacillus chartarius]|uniref:ADP-heptose synthase n=1 Tax=Paenibacillus chartarius TaxID=747481 RepID=A0ABV6DVH2_9BACL
MTRRIVIEAVLLTTYGQLLVPGKPVEYLIPYSTVMELYDMRDSGEAVMPDPREDEHVKKKIAELIAFFEDSFNKKKLERSLTLPWKKSPPFPINEHVTLTVVNAVDNAYFGEAFDPVETELLLTAMQENVALLTDQLDFLDKCYEAGVGVLLFDIEDFELALEDDLKV